MDLQEPPSLEAVTPRGRTAAHNPSKEALMFPINRIVVLLTPVFSAGAAVGSAWLLKHSPGVPTPSAGELLGVEITVATSAGAAALRWLHGHQAYEQRLMQYADVLKQGEAAAAKADPKLLEEVKAFVEGEVSRVLSHASVNIAGAPPVSAAAVQPPAAAAEPQS